MKRIAILQFSLLLVIRSFLLILYENHNKARGQGNSRVVTNYEVGMNVFYTPEAIFLGEKVGDRFGDIACPGDLKRDGYYNIIICANGAESWDVEGIDNGGLR